MLFLELIDALKAEGGKVVVDLGNTVKTLPECQFSRKYVRSWKILEIHRVRNTQSRKPL